MRIEQPIRWRDGLIPLSADVAAQLRDLARAMAQEMVTLAWELDKAVAEGEARRERARTAARERFKARFGAYPERRDGKTPARPSDLDRAKLLVR